MSQPNNALVECSHCTRLVVGDATDGMHADCAMVRARADAQRSPEEIRRDARRRPGPKPRDWRKLGDEAPP